jgi:tetratricopeptide (TPR) repeat protein
VSYNASLEALRLRIERGDRIEPRRLTLRQGAALTFQMPGAVLVQNTSDDYATPYLVIALALDPQLQQARTLWAQALVRGERTQEAIRVLSEVPEVSPFYAAARGQLANLLLSEGRDAAALRVAAEALAARPDRSLKLQIANLYRTLKREADAETVLTQLIAADAAAGQTDWRVYFLRGAARERQAKWEGSEADLKRALELEPENATVLNYLGYSWIDRGVNLEEGFGLIRQAVALEPDSGHIVDSLGWAHYRLGEYEQAVEYLERAATLLPADVVVNDHLGDAYWKTGRRKEAGFQWRRVLKLDPPAEDRERIEQKLLGGLDRDPAPGAAVAR